MLVTGPMRPAAPGEDLAARGEELAEQTLGLSEPFLGEGDRFGLADWIGDEAFLPQPIKPKIERHLEATHDGGLDVVERDLETDDRIGAHAARADVVADTVHRQGNSSSIRLAG